MEFRDLQSYARWLNTLKNPGSILQGKQLHLVLLKKGVLSALSIGNRLVQMYARCGRMGDARNLFDEMPQKNCFTWNALLEGYAKSGSSNGGLLDLFMSMPIRDEVSWNTVVSGLVRDGDLDGARKVFDEMPRKTCIAWNTMIHGYAKNGGSWMALRLFKEFLKWEFGGSVGVFGWDPFILATVVGACSDTGGLDIGKQVHARMIIDRVEFDCVLRSALTNMYGKCGDLDSAARVLSAMEDPDDYSLSSLISSYTSFGRMDDAKRIFGLKSNPCVGLWNSLISGYVANDDPAEALILFGEMNSRGVVGDCSTFSSVLNACSDVGVIRNCIRLHSFAYKLGILNDIGVTSALIDAYAKCGSSTDACVLFSDVKSFDTILLNLMITVYSNCGRINEAKRVFGGMKSKSLISWNAMIVALNQNGYPMEALTFFHEMNVNGLRMDKFSLAAAVAACASVPLPEFGEQIFARSIAVGLNTNRVVATSIIDFYCKIGSIELARKVFDQMTNPDEVSWNSMLMGYATNGYGHDVLALFREMTRNGATPSKITFTAVLSACDHCGLVDDGMEWFLRMKRDYDIDPEKEHYSCMIDLLARAGRLQEAIGLIDEVPPGANSNMWSAVLRGCAEYGDHALSKKVAERITEVDGENSGALIQFSRAMASAGEWTESEMVRRAMREQNVAGKTAGRSWCGI
ncbi:putative pentatricopeptide repeat-containing protein At1g77010, mitochondrial [Andrographis paniculata]|uniref:putative pentatricopeptide repeat-containing protein At1g77010, mitochondrial n=1 Tax=Andrographis paniculata TaxID=175694 RepID=UPI0021E96F56|nr:putative pentatricopeptide repeat-containing protein At1g77010, mitochondrial [Andrographis paniculata]